MRKVDVSGNRHFKDKEITSVLATSPPQGLIFKDYAIFDPVALQLDRRRVEAFYKERGFFRARVVDTDVRPRGGNKVDVKFVVEEGEPTHLAAVEVQGAPANIDGRKIASKIGVGQGKRFDHPNYLIAKDTIQKELAKKGYAHAVVDGTVEVNRDTRRAVVKLQIDTGPVVRFGDLEVEGLERLPESAVRNRVGWDEGDVFDPIEIEKTQARLYALGTFSVVRVDFAKEGRPPVSDVTIHVKEGTRHEVRLGGGVGFERNRTEVHARAGYTKRGFLHPLATLRLDARPGYTLIGASGETGFSAEAVATLEKEDLWIPRLKGGVTLAYDFEPREAFTYRGPRAAINFERPLFHEHLRAYVGWSLQQLTFTRVDSALTDPAVAGMEWDLDPYRVGFYKQALAWDYRDKALDARKGYYLSVEIEEGGPFAGGTFGYTKVTPEGRLYVPITERLVWATRLRGGRMFGENQDNGPITQRYYGGGASLHRGFGYRRLSPMVELRDGNQAGQLAPIGGAEMVLGSAELRYDWFKWRDSWFGVTAFLDAGDVTEAGELKMGNLHYAAGLGLRYDTVIGPIRLDVGYRLNRWQVAGADGLDNPDPGSGFKRVAFHFSIGEAF